MGELCVWDAGGSGGRAGGKNEEGRGAGGGGEDKGGDGRSAVCEGCVGRAGFTCHGALGPRQLRALTPTRPPPRVSHNFSLV